MHTWCDIGVNLFSSQFDADRASVLQNAHQQGVSQLILIGSDLPESTLNQRFCQQNLGCYTTAGVHPHQAANVQANWLLQLRQLIEQPYVVAVGECGLDFNRDFSPRHKQQQVFAEQLQLAKTFSKAVYLHERDAFDTQISILREHQIERGVAHCFTGCEQQLKTYLDLGLYIGITGWICDERRGEMLRQAVKYIPLDRLLLETDAPYLLPRTLATKPKSRRNEPAYLTEIAKQLATLIGVEASQLSEHTLANAQKLFDLASNTSTCHG